MGRLSRVVGDMRCAKKPVFQIPRKAETSLSIRQKCLPEKLSTPSLYYSAEPWRLSTGSARRWVTVHTLERSEGAGWRAKWAWMAAVRSSKLLRDCRWQVSTTVRMVSTKRLPPVLCVPNDSFRQMTAGRNARSLARRPSGEIVPSWNASGRARGV